MNSCKYIIDSNIKDADIIGVYGYGRIGKCFVYYLKRHFPKKTFYIIDNNQKKDFFTSNIFTYDEISKKIDTIFILISNQKTALSILNDIQNKHRNVIIINPLCYSFLLFKCQYCFSEILQKIKAFFR